MPYRKHILDVYQIFRICGKLLAKIVTIISFPVFLHLCNVMQAFPSSGGVHPPFPDSELSWDLIWSVKCGRSDSVLVPNLDLKRPYTFPLWVLKLLSCLMIKPRLVSCGVLETHGAEKECARGGHSPSDCSWLMCCYCR